MKSMLKFIASIWVSMIVNSLLPITDLVFLNQLSPSYFSAVGIGTVPYALISGLLIGIGIETNRTLARGEKLRFWHVATFALLFSSLLMILSDIFADDILFFARQNVLYHEIRNYFIVMNFSFLPTSVLYICTGVVRGKGVPQKSIYFSLLAVVLNAFFDYLFIKIHLLGDPVSGVGLASAISDTLMVTLYVIYLAINHYTDNDRMNLYKFARNAITDALEKVLAASTLEVIVSAFMVTLSTTDSDTYFGLDRFLQPCLLFSYAFLEWVIYAKAKEIQTRRSIYLYYFLLLIPYNLVLVLYLRLNVTGMIFSLLYLFYVFLFLVERTFVGLLFAEERGNTVNYIVLIKNVLLLVVLAACAYNGSFTLISFGIVNLLCICLEIAMLGIAVLKRRPGISTTVNLKQ